ncbi:MAG TPA: hypothetical protein VGE93_05905 [Bryobacteraceae bacterium]
MTSSLEIKITISEFVTPELFRAMSAVSNPRQRAALLKRLAEEALRENVSIGDTALAATSVIARSNVVTCRSAQSGAAPRSHPLEPRRLMPQTGILNEERKRFGYGFLVDNLSGAGNTQTFRGVAEVRHYVVTGTASPRETAASISSVILSYKASTTCSVVGPTTRAQTQRDGEVTLSDTIMQPNRSRGVRMWVFVAAALGIGKAAYRFRRAITGRWKKESKDIR